MRNHNKTSLQLWNVKRPKKRKAIKKPPKLFPIGKIPVVDVHMHIRPNSVPQGTVEAATRKYLQTMNKSGITLSVNLAGTRESVALADKLHKISKGRILQAPGTYLHGPTRKLWWTVKELDTFIHPNIAGIKILNKYNPKLFEKKSLLGSLQRQSELRLSLIGLHVVDPPFKGFWQPHYWDCIVAAEKLIRNYPDLTFIMAHGFWLMNTDEGLDVLGTYFDAYPNLNVDLCAVFQWWNNPYVTYDKLRKFIIKYKGRLLYGTDGNPAYTKPFRFQHTFELLETAKPNCRGFFMKPDVQTQMTGLKLPEDVLNHIYWWNAARLLPNVDTALRKQNIGIKIGGK